MTTSDINNNVSNTKTNLTNDTEYVEADDELVKKL